MGAKDDTIVQNFLGICRGLESKYLEKDYKAVTELFGKLPVSYQKEAAATLYNSLKVGGGREEMLIEVKTIWDRL